MSDRATTVDRAGLVRRAFLELVAERGFRGTSMAAVADRAGVAAGTIYVHYASKDDLIAAVYRQVKAELGRAAVEGVDPTDPPALRFEQMWLAAHAHLAGDPVRARFLTQVEASPMIRMLHAERGGDPDDELSAAARAPDMVEALLDLPAEVLYLLGLAPAVELAALADVAPLDPPTLETVAHACWRAVTA